MSRRADNQYLQFCWVYVDDMGVFGDPTLKDKLIKDLGTRFDISDEGPLQYYLGINIRKHKDRVTMDQKKHICDILKEFGVQDEHPVCTPMAAKPPRPQDHPM